MAYIKTTIQPITYVQVPTWFITDYMPKALAGHTKVYLYLLTLTLTAPNTPINLETVSTDLQMLYSELIQALKYWDEQKVIIFNEGDEETFELNFLTTPPHPSKDTPSEVPYPKEISPTQQKTILKPTRPEYGTEEINVYLHNSAEVAELFKLAEDYLGRLLNTTEQKMLFGLYDWLHMPFELIEFLIAYCSSNNHKTMRYIEQVAINWVDEGITTLEQAKNKTFSDKRYFKILNSLGSNKATLTPAEKKCMSKWLDTYHFSMEIILEACKRTVMQTNKPSLNYADSILSAWHVDKVKTLEDIAALDKAHESKKIVNASTFSSPAVSNKIAKFNSMYSHDWDFDELEKLQEEHITRKLNGGN